VVEVEGGGADKAVLLQEERGVAALGYGFAGAKGTKGKKPQ